MKSIGLVWVRAKVQSNANQSLTRGQSLRRLDLNTTIVRAKYANKGPRMGYRQANHPRSLRSRGTSRCPSCPPTPKSKTPWKPLETCKQRREEILEESNHHLYIQCSAPIELTTFMRKRYLNSDSKACNSLYHLQKGPNGTIIQITPLRRTCGGLRMAWTCRT